MKHEPIENPNAPIVTELAEGIIYDAMEAMNRHAGVLVTLLNEHGTKEQKMAYKDGVYSVSMKLGMIIGTDGIARQRERHERIAQKLQDFIDSRKQTDERNRIEET